MGLHQNATDALARIQSGQRVFIQGACATPLKLIDGLIQRATELRDIEIMHLHTAGNAPYAHPEFEGVFRVANLFVGENIRPLINYQDIDYVPCFLSEIPSLFRRGQRTPDVALIHVSPPDSHGFCTLGTSVDVAVAAVETARLVIAQINPHMPRVHGDGIIHISRIDEWIEVDEPLPEAHSEKPGAIEQAIGQFAAELIENGSTLQTGIGAVPDAVLAALKSHRHLGLHTEMWSNGALELIRAGVIDNSRKNVFPGKTVSAFITGTREVYDFIDDNPSVLQLETSTVNNTAVIARNPKVVAINSAVEVDLTGQVCADSIGPRVISGVGGQMDFIRGASLSPGGKPIIALSSRTRKGTPRIVPQLKAGAGVVTTRAHVHYVVTEYGIADLYGRTIGERARLLIAIAHPDDRDRLSREWHDVMRKN